MVAKILHGNSWRIAEVKSADCCYAFAVEPLQSASYEPMRSLLKNGLVIVREIYQEIIATRNLLIVNNCLHLYPKNPR